jgi:hypothetical protein
MKPQPYRNAGGRIVFPSTNEDVAEWPHPPLSKEELDEIGWTDVVDALVETGPHAAPVEDSDEE